MHRPPRPPSHRPILGIGGSAAKPHRDPPVAGAYRSDPGVGSPSAKTSAITQQPFRAMPKAIPTRV